MIFLKKKNNFEDAFPGTGTSLFAPAGDDRGGHDRIALPAGPIQRHDGELPEEQRKADPVHPQRGQSGDVCQRRPRAPDPDGVAEGRAG